MLTYGLDLERLLCGIKKLNWRVPFDGRGRDCCILFGLIVSVGILDESEMDSGDIFGMLMIESKLYVLESYVFLVVLHLLTKLDWFVSGKVLSFKGRVSCLYREEL